MLGAFDIATARIVGIGNLCRLLLVDYRALLFQNTTNVTSQFIARKLLTVDDGEQHKSLQDAHPPPLSRLNGLSRAISHGEGLLWPACCPLRLCVAFTSSLLLRTQSISSASECLQICVELRQNLNLSVETFGPTHAALLDL